MQPIKYLTEDQCNTYEEYKEYLKEKSLTPDERISRIKLLNSCSNLDAFSGKKIISNKRCILQYPDHCIECNELRDILYKIVIFDTKPWKKASEDCFQHFTSEKKNFKKIKSLKNQKEREMTSYHYALSHFSGQLEKLSDLSFNEIKAQCSAYGIQYIINKYFEKVEVPIKGHLIVYSKDEKDKHAGIYQANQCVESKWNSELSGRYVFEHEVFFGPSDWGNEATFYQPKLRIPIPPLIIFPDNSIPMNSGYQYKKNDENDAIRKEIQDLKGLAISDKFSEITFDKNTNFNGMCYHYAFGKSLKNYYFPTFYLFTNKQFLDNNFTPVEIPQSGDLAVYYAEDRITMLHYGIYLDDQRIESKWGHDSVYRHPPFLVPPEYGDFIRYYRPIKGASKEWDSSLNT